MQFSPWYAPSEPRGAPRRRLIFLSPTFKSLRGTHRNPRGMASPALDGFSATALFSQGTLFHHLVGLLPKQTLLCPGYCYTYDDVIFHPGFIDFAADQVRSTVICDISSSGLKKSTGRSVNASEQKCFSADTLGKLSYGYRFVVHKKYAHIFYLSRLYSD